MEALLAAILGLLSDVLFYRLSQSKPDDKREKALKVRLKGILEEAAREALSEQPLSVGEQNSLKDLTWSFDSQLSEDFFTLLSRETGPTLISTDDSSSSAYSNAAIRDLLVRFAEKKGVEGVSEAALSRVVPEIITLCIQKTSLDAELAEYVAHIQNANIIASINLYHMEVLENLSVLQDGQKVILARMETFAGLMRDFADKDRTTNETIAKVLRFFYRSQYRDSSNLYFNKLFAGVHSEEMRSSFRFFAPRLYPIRPEDFVERAGRVIIYVKNKLSIDELLVAIKNKKGLFLVAEAGVGKTTFLLYLHLLFLRNFSAHRTLPIFANVKNVFGASSNVSSNIASYLAPRPISIEAKEVDDVFNHIAHQGWLLLLLDSLDQTDDLTHLKDFLVKRGDSTRVVIACREEKYLGNRQKYEGLFQGFQWIYLDKFSQGELAEYLRPELEPKNVEDMHKDVRSLLRTRFYAAAAKKILQQPGERLRVFASRKELMDKFIDHMFHDAALNRGIPFCDQDRPEVEDFLATLAFDTLRTGKIQDFPNSFLKEQYQDNWKRERDLLFKTNWVYFKHRLFDAAYDYLPEKSPYQCSFFHQLLQEYFAAKKMSKDLCGEMRDFSQALENLQSLSGEQRARQIEEMQSFGQILKEMPFSEVILDFLDDMLPDRATFDFCMDLMRTSLDLANERKDGLADTGHKYTWLLALRDRNGDKPELLSELQSIFDEEMKKSQETETEGKFVKIPAGAFVMGGYEYVDEQPARVVYLSEYWISKYAERFVEYDKYCFECKKELPDDEEWGRGDRPVINVNWHDAVDYIAWLGDGYGLPTEAQWEKASRGSLGRKYPWGNTEPDAETANFYEGSLKTVEVESFLPYMYGIHQMSGNVGEWCRDRYGHYSECTATDPAGWSWSFGSFWVIRGGFERLGKWDCRSVDRDRFRPTLHDQHLGFRLARTQ